jgi:uncharacterized damage-inducible protein DinB
MVINKELAKQVGDTLGTFISLLTKIPPEQFNIVPFEGSWTAGQLAQHMILSNSGFADIVNGPVKNTDRAVDENVPQLRRDFLNFDIKMQTPDFIRPEKKDYDKDDALAALNNIRMQISEAAETLDLTKTCLAFEVPVLGYLTRFEAINFVDVHTQRHVHQLKNIYNELNKK